MALVAKAANPLRVHWTRRAPAFTADHDPVERGRVLAHAEQVSCASLESVHRCSVIRPDIREIDRPKQRFGAYPSHRCGSRQQVRNSLIGALLIFSADAEPDVRKNHRTIRRACEASKRGATTFASRRRHIEDMVMDEPRSDRLFAHIVAHSIRPLREHLEDMLGAQRHDGEDLVDPLIRHVLMEEVAMRTDEYHARLLPAHRLIYPLLVEPNLTRPFWTAAAHARQPRPRRVILQASARQLHRIAVRAAWRSQGTAGDRIPRGVGPLDFCLVAHAAPRS